MIKNRFMRIPLAGPVFPVPGFSWHREQNMTLIKPKLKVLIG
jgi:hypothetical protein